MSVRQDIVCQEFVEEVTNYLEGKLSEAEERWTDEHLAQCPHCRAYLAQMRSTISALRASRERGGRRPARADSGSVAVERRVRPLQEAVHFVILRPGLALLVLP